MSMWTRRNFRLNRFRDFWSERRMRSAPIVVDCEFLYDPTQMPLVAWNQIVQALSPNRSDQAFTKCICHRRSHWRFQNPHFGVFQHLVHFRGKDRVAVVDHESVRMLKGQVPKKPDRQSSIWSGRPGRPPHRLRARPALCRY